VWASGQVGASETVGGGLTRLRTGTRSGCAWEGNPVVCLDGGKRRDPKRAHDPADKKTSSVRYVYMQVKYTRCVIIAEVHVNGPPITPLT
jgi:hypothetical protein